MQPPLSPLYDGPYLVLERSIHYFKIQLGTRTDTVSTHRLKACHAPFGAEATLQPARDCPRALILSAAEVQKFFLMVFMLHGQEGPQEAWSLLRSPVQIFLRVYLQLKFHGQEGPQDA